ncbi:SH3 domain-containing kinase-binding protein 1 isoform X7 [Denticeps clupeoides]|uniref:SH3 domain-containing kinase-binding protein 1 isoform X7 n=1 Tax=Denticeps clupeoides TaxID=299321 RepID=UPI0010A5818D|nr:SH3 domain-containing kinase-binding protein 1 isoform X7 [Denticeps clupeoides]
MVEAIVEYDYQAAHDDELSISIGDIISNIRKDDGGWWEGELAGRRGLFPDNFVRELKKEVKKEAGQGTQMPSGPKADLSNGSASPGSEPSLRKKGDNIRKRRCMAAFSYLPQNEDELELKIGDVIEVLAEVEEGWWEGYLNGKTGMFPSNFTKEFPVPEDPSTPQEDTRSTRTSAKDSTGSESDGGDSGSVRSDAGSAASGSEIQPKKVRGFGFGDIFKDQPIKLRPRSMDVDSEQEKLTAKKSTPPVATETMKTEPDNKVKAKEYCKVIFQYEAQNEDELSIKEGEIVAIVSKDCADAGWWLGELNGKQGVFPDNFVKLFVPEVEKERPKKPPPPAAPATKQITDVEDFDSIVSSTEKLNHPTASRPRVTDRRPRSQLFTSSSLSSPDLLDSPSPEEERREKEKAKEEHDSVPSRVYDNSRKIPKPVPVLTTHDTKSSLPPKPSVLSSSSSGSGAQLHPGHPSGASVRPHSPSPESRAKGESGHVTLEELRAQLKELRGTVELMKSQHRQEIKQLVSELDEEKKIRLSLQMEVEHIKKILSK